MKRSISWKADVEGRIAEVDYLVVEQDELALMNEDVLGAVIAVDEAESAGEGFFDELVEELTRSGNLLGGVAVIRLDAEGFEEGAVFEEGLEISAASRFGMDRADEPAELVEMVLDDVVGEEKGFEIVVRIGNGRHGQKIVLRIFENKRGDGAGGSELGEMFEGEGFATDALGVGEPICFYAEFGEGLLEDPGFAGGAFDEHGFIGDAAAQVVDLGLLGFGDAVGLDQVIEELVGLFDVK